MNAVINKEIEVVDLGMVDYMKGWDYQTDLFEKTIQIKLDNRKLPESEHQATPNFLLFCEHPHVFTLGKSGKEDNLLASEELLKKRKAKYYKTNRGGDITYHGPGQIVGYPILDLENFFTDIHKYMRLMEEAVILTLGAFGISSGRFEGLTGVWLDPRTIHARKICAMGVKTSRWVTMHGFALNVNTDLSYFENIVPCGISDKNVTSMQKELKRPVDMEDVRKSLIANFVEVFEMSLKV